MLEEDRKLFVRKIGKDVQDQEMDQGKTLMLIGVIVGVFLLLLGLILGLLIVNYYLYIILGLGAVVIIVATSAYYGHRKSWEKKSFQVIGDNELERVRDKIRDNDISENYRFDLLNSREKLIYYTYDLDYLNVLDEHEETRTIEIKVKGKLETREKTVNVKTYSLVYNDGSKKELTTEDDYINGLIIDFIYKEPVKATDGILRAE